ncbi:hypothetical protein FEMY_13310 [Ferrovum myxofaciens]|jgi:hypothetical protein|uniref:Uncharacterized protein n=2 Tax=root TaxID=1 RepID=A0A149VZ40_9PROT|nr:hypothetical protein FEMY_13310 [Ferrovum myxofaciens]
MAGFMGLGWVKINGKSGPNLLAIDNYPQGAYKGEKSGICCVKGQPAWSYDRRFRVFEK